MTVQLQIAALDAVAEGLWRVRHGMCFALGYAAGRSRRPRIRRLVRHANIVVTDGSSYRMREARIKQGGDA